MPKGYETACGWMGRMPDGTWMLFATEEEYLEAYWDEVSSD